MKVEKKWPPCTGHTISQGSFSRENKFCVYFVACNKSLGVIFSFEHSFGSDYYGTLDYMLTLLHSCLQILGRFEKVLPFLAENDERRKWPKNQSLDTKIAILFCFPC